MNIFRNKLVSILFLILILERLAVTFVFKPIIYPDSASYKRIAVSLVDNKSFGEIKKRTPGYPLFLAMIYSFIRNDRFVVLLQHVLGLLLIFVMIKMSYPDVIKVIAAVIYIFDMHILRYEHSVLADFMLAFVLSLSVFLLHEFFIRHKKIYIFLTSVTVGYGIMVKPVLKLYPYAVIIVLILYFIKSRKPMFDLLKTVIVFIIPVTIIWGSWSLRNYFQKGFFGLTESFGSEMIAMTENFIDFNSPEYKDVKEIYKKHLKTKKSKRDYVISKVQIELKDKYSDEEINMIFSGIAKEALRKHPLKYLRRVARESCYFLLTNNSILTVFLPEQFEVGSGMIRDFKKGEYSGALKKFLLNFYLFQWLIILGFIVYLFVTLAKGANMPPSDLSVLITVVYIMGVTVMIQRGMSRYRLAVQHLIIFGSCYGWNYILNFLKMAYRKK